MSDPRFDTLLAALRRWAPLPDAEWEGFAKGLQLVNLSTGETLVRERESAERVAFVLQGLLKVFYLTRDGDEYIRTFCPEQTFAADLAALYQGKAAPSTVTITAIEPCVVVTFDYETFRQRLPHHWTWQQIGRLIAERYYLVRERRQFELLTMTAEERLQVFLHQHPGLAGRISQKDFARFLGITPESLSRLRARSKV